MNTLLEQRDARRKPVDVVLSADGAEFAGGEEAGEGERAADFLDHFRVVVGFGEEA